MGSGVVEAPCKTVVTQRMKRSGQRWGIDGGQAILTFRALAQSDRFDAAWQLLSASYRRNITPSQNIVTINTVAWRQCESYTQSIVFRDVRERPFSRRESAIIQA
jgi:hypothetical protein